MCLQFFLLGHKIRGKKKGRRKAGMGYYRTKTNGIQRDFIPAGKTKKYD